MQVFAGVYYTRPVGQKIEAFMPGCGDHFTCLLENMVQSGVHSSRRHNFVSHFNVEFDFLLLFFHLSSHYFTLFNFIPTDTGTFGYTTSQRKVRKNPPDQQNKSLYLHTNRVCIYQWWPRTNWHGSHP